MMAFRVFSSAWRSVAAECRGRGSCIPWQNHQHNIPIFSNSFHSLLPSPDRKDNHLSTSPVHHSLLNPSTFPKLTRVKTTQSSDLQNDDAAPVNVKLAKTNVKADKKIRFATSSRSEGSWQAIDLLTTSADNVEPKKKKTGDSKMTNEAANCSLHESESLVPLKTNDSGWISNSMLTLSQAVKRGDIDTKETEIYDSNTEKERAVFEEDLMKVVLKLKSRCKETEKLQKKMLHYLIKAEESQQKMVGDQEDMRKALEQILNYFHSEEERAEKSEKRWNDFFAEVEKMVKEMEENKKILDEFNKSLTKLKRALFLLGCAGGVAFVVNLPLY